MRYIGPFRCYLQQSSPKHALIEKHAILDQRRFGKFYIGIAFWVTSELVTQYSDSVYRSAGCKVLLDLFGRGAVVDLWM